MKRGGKKMCNHFHLGHYCSQGNFCKFQHEPKLSPGELTALMFKTRSLACSNRKCEDIFCCKSHFTPGLLRSRLHDASIEPRAR